MLKKLLCVSLASLAVSAHAQDNPAAQSESSTPSFLGMSLIDAQPREQVWLDSGFETAHFDRHAGLNGNNYGVGAEFRFSTVSSVTVGRFYNSNRAYSNYVGVYYQPIRLGMVQLGAVVGGFNGYPNMRDGGWFLAAIPTASLEWHRLGFNLAFVPSIKNRLYGGISLQVKVKLWD